MPVRIYSCRYVVLRNRNKLFKKLPVLVIVLSFFVCQVSFAQRVKIDSLKKVLPTLHDSERMDCFNHCGYGIGRKKVAELKDRSGMYKSMGMKITESRIAMMQKVNGENKSIEIKDLVYADGSAAGKEVVLKIPVEQP